MNRVYDIATNPFDYEDTVFGRLITSGAKIVSLIKPLTIKGVGIYSYCISDGNYGLRLLISDIYSMVASLQSTYISENKVSTIVTTASELRLKSTNNAPHDFRVVYNLLS
jgi:hypothetical protein